MPPPIASSGLVWIDSGQLGGANSVREHRELPPSFIGRHRIEKSAAPMHFGLGEGWLCKFRNSDSHRSEWVESRKRSGEMTISAGPMETLE